MLGQSQGRQKRGGAAGPVLPFQFDMEKTLHKAEDRKKYLERVEARIAQIREQLRAGGSQEVFDHLTTLLNAYNGLKKVIERAR
ncbi:MAG: DUF5398 family protein [Chlamydiia bacterium]